MSGAVAEPPLPSFFTVALASPEPCFSTRTSVVSVVIFSSAMVALLSLKADQLATADLVHSFNVSAPVHASPIHFPIPYPLPVSGPSVLNTALLQRFPPLFARLSSRDFLSSLGPYSSLTSGSPPTRRRPALHASGFPSIKDGRRDVKIGSRGCHAHMADNARASRAYPARLPRAMLAVPPFEFPSKCPLRGPFAASPQSGSRRPPSRTSLDLVLVGRPAAGLPAHEINMPNCKCGHPANKHCWLPGARGECWKCRCEMYRPNAYTTQPAPRVNNPYIRRLRPRSRRP
jgi:hypothetical protein